MKAKGPILTLLAVVVLALVLLTVNLTTQSEDDTTKAAQPAPTAPAAPPPIAEPAAPAPVAPPAATGNPFPAQATYTGKTAGRKVGEASVAVAVKDGKASAYLCDGKKLESWLEGQAEGSSLKLTGKDGSTLNGTLADGKLSGDVTVGGLTWSFAATPGKSPSGLYRARKANADAGWIVYPDGKQTGVQNIGGNPSEAPWLDPATGNAVLGGSAIPVTTIQGGDAATVGR
jgi:serine/threonine-protein kinase